MPIRLLTQADFPALEAFLSKHRDTSMFLRSNARRAGLDYAGQRFQGVYFGQERGSELVGVVCHGWSGVLLLQAPEDTGELARECLAASGRAPVGIIGPLEQLRRAREALGLEDAPVAVDAQDRLYALDLEALVAPAALESGALQTRSATAEDAATLGEWRVAYDIETLGATPSEDQRRRAIDLMDAQIAAGEAWVALDADRLVALSAFNAALPDIVQLGGIYTPPDLRGRGYARAAVAGQLLAARHRGARRAVLFTKNPSAMRCYEALGFRHIGSFGLLLFRRSG